MVSMGNPLSRRSGVKWTTGFPPSAPSTLKCFVMFKAVQKKFATGQSQGKCKSNSCSAFRWRFESKRSASFVESKIIPSRTILTPQIVNPPGVAIGSISRTPRRLFIERGGSVIFGRGPCIRSGGGGASGLPQSFSTDHPTIYHETNGIFPLPGFAVLRYNSSVHHASLGCMMIKFYYILSIYIILYNHNIYNHII